MLMLHVWRRTPIHVFHLLLVFLCTAPPATAQELPLQILFDFPQPPSGPAGPLVRGPDGTLYGTLTGADGNPLYGPSAAGGIYALKPDGAGRYTYQLLHQFETAAGSLPTGLVLGPDGHLYGTTVSGGPGGAGTIFRITMAGQFTSLYAFRGIDGSQPFGKLMLARDGNFYGTTLRGGLFDTGTIYRFSPGGTLKPLHWFGGSEGAFPAAGLVQARDGNFYGTALRGGPELLAAGTVFKMTPNGIVTRLHAFASVNESLGTWPAGTLIEASDGHLYGTTYRGGPGNAFGTVFKISTAGAFTQLHAFTDGQHPAVSLTEAADGSLWGVASGGFWIGDFLPSGVFRMSRTGGDFEWVTAFNFKNGEVPWGDLLLAPDGSLFGSTTTGGAGACGTVFRVNPERAFETLHQFSCVVRNPHALTGGSDGYFYGVTRDTAGGFRRGSIFRLSADGDYTPLHTLGRGDGTDLSGLVEAPDGNFYGTTRLGGRYGSGAVFRVTPAGAYSEIASFGEFNGISGRRLIVADDGNLYGTTEYPEAGRSNVFRVTADGSLTFLPAPEPIFANTIIQGHDGYFYGTSDTGGGNGRVFRLSKEGALTILHTFSADEGSAPREIMQASDGDLYGATVEGGAAGLGTLFRMTTGGATTILHAFTDGRAYAALTEAADGQLYGTSGSVFRLDLNRVFSVLHTFAADSSEGAQFPGVVQGPDAALYGVTSNGYTAERRPLRGLFYRIALVP